MYKMPVWKIKTATMFFCGKSFLVNDFGVNSKGQGSELFTNFLPRCIFTS